MIEELTNAYRAWRMNREHAHWRYVQYMQAIKMEIESLAQYELLCKNHGVPSNDGCWTKYKLEVYNET